MRRLRHARVSHSGVCYECPPASPTRRLREARVSAQAGCSNVRRLDEAPSIRVGQRMWTRLLAALECAHRTRASKGEADECRPAWSSTGRSPPASCTGTASRRRMLASFSPPGFIPLAGPAPLTREGPANRPPRHSATTGRYDCPWGEESRRVSGICVRQGAGLPGSGGQTRKEKLAKWTWL